MEMTLTPTMERKKKEPSLSAISTSDMRNVGSDESKRLLDSEAHQSVINPVSEEGVPMQDLHANQQPIMLSRE